MELAWIQHHRELCREEPGEDFGNFSVFFPVSRESSLRERFALDSIHRH